MEARNYLLICLLIGPCRSNVHWLVLPGPSQHSPRPADSERGRKQKAGGHKRAIHYPERGAGDEIFASSKRNEHSVA
ncbi:hypothetical protein BaRGS_00031445 [Batillaria attramentaria]|uniref:Secreted protein n=1 Tax=Batillaria attramentaria TaxID=370345 RepID=A0ABD0JRS0_9CAEN